MSMFVEKAEAAWRESQGETGAVGRWTLTDAIAHVGAYLAWHSTAGIYGEALQSATQGELSEMRAKMQSQGNKINRALKEKRA